MKEVEAGFMVQEKTFSETISINPATGKEIGRSPLHSEDDLKRMIDDARVMQPAWAALSVKQRSAYFYDVLHFLTQHVDDLAQTISDDNGKLPIDALAAEVVPAAIATAYYIRKAKRFLRDRRTGTSSIAFINKRTIVRRVPYGVLGIISPWNYPFSIAYSEVIMGLISGNAVILKTASETQMVGLALKEAIDAAGLPQGLFQFINLPGREAGPGFLKCGVDKLFFTGSVPVGKTLMKMAADTLTPLNLELGGNDAMIVCEDADLERAVAGTIWAGFSNAGQSCGGIERIYVQEKVYQPFLDLLKSETEKLRLGTDTDGEVDMGAMTTERQVKSVQKQVDDALAAGAILYAQSPAPKNESLKNIIPAIVLTNVNHQMNVMRDETFGPVVGIMPFKTIEEAVALANDSYLGLTGSVWSRNRRKAKSIARQIQAGAVTINDHLMSHGLPETSWGGFKQSGIGRTHGQAGFMEMTQPQMIVDDWLSRLKKNLWWPPYNKSVYEGLKGLIVGFYGTGILQRIKGLYSLIKIIPRMFK